MSGAVLGEAILKRRAGPPIHARRAGARSAAVAAALLAAGAGAAAPRLSAAGKPLYDRYCVGCHEIGLGAANGEGPELNGIIGLPAASIKGYAYSTANRRSAVVWTARTLADFLASPRTVMAGTRMTVPGIGSPDERDAIVAYVSRFQPDGTMKPTN